MCPICYDDEKPMNYVMQCGHSFHTRCLIKWWAKQDETQGCVSCPLCRYNPSNDEIDHLRMCSAANAWIKYISLGEDKVKSWIEKVKRFTHITPMENVLGAPEFVPQ